MSEKLDNKTTELFICQSDAVVEQTLWQNRARLFNRKGSDSMVYPSKIIGNIYYFQSKIA